MKKYNIIILILLIILVSGIQGCGMKSADDMNNLADENPKTLEEIRAIQEGIDNEDVVNALEETRAIQESIQKSGFTDPLEVLEWNWGYEGSNLKYVEGIVKNNMDFEYNNLQLKFDLYNKEGNKITNAVDTLNNLAPYGTWTFKAPIFEFDIPGLGNEVTDARLAQLTGFPS
jgi:hypothetical protein